MPSEEDQRLAALAQLHDPGAAEPALDALVEVAASACGAPIALLSLVGAERQCVKARVGLPTDEMAAANSPCAHVVADGSLVVEDITADPRFSDGTLAGSAGVRGYAGAPLVTVDGHRIGVLAVCSRETMVLSGAQIMQLERLATVAARYLEKQGALHESLVESEDQRARMSELEFARGMLEEQAAGLVALAEDRDELYQANLRQSQFIETLIDTMPIPIFARDPALKFTHANRAYAALYGVDRDALLGMTFADIVDAETAQAMGEEDRLVLAEPSGRRTFEKRIKPRHSSEVRDVVLHKARLRGQDGSFLGMVGAIVDVTESKALQAKLEHIAATDTLTGAATRRAFMEKAGEEMQRAARYGHPLSLIMIDIDKFKTINDLHGHQAGDEVLRRISAVCTETVREGVDLFARFGGEEFVVVLPETDIDGAARAAERLRRAIACSPVEYAGTTINVTASFGVSAVEEADTDIEESLKLADACLYLSKQRGRNRVTVHGDNQDASAALEHAT